MSSATRAPAPWRGAHATMLIGTGLMTVALAVAPLVGVYPVFLMKALCFALFACARDRNRNGCRRAARCGRRIFGDKAAGHLFRDDHPGRRTDDVFLLSANAVHPRRRRHPGGSARPPVRAAGLVAAAGDVLHG